MKLSAIALVLTPLAAIVAAEVQIFIAIRGLKQGNFFTTIPSAAIPFATSALGFNLSALAVTQGRPTFSPLVIRKPVDSGTGKALEALATDELLETVTVLVRTRSAAGAFVRNSQYELSNALVHSVDVDASLNGVFETTAFTWIKMIVTTFTNGANPSIVTLDTSSPLLTA